MTQALTAKSTPSLAPAAIVAAGMGIERMVGADDIGIVERTVQ